MGKRHKIRDYAGGLLIGLLFTACTSLTTDKDWTRNGKIRLVLDWGIRAPRTGVFDYYFYADGNSVPLVRRGDASGYHSAGSLRGRGL